MEYRIEHTIMDPRQLDLMQTPHGSEGTGLGMVQTDDGFQVTGEESKILKHVYKNLFLHIVTDI